MTEQDGTILREGYDEMHFAEIREMLENTYWSPGISREEIIKGAANSALVVGAFTSGNEQVGFARVISDKTRFAYILDVVVREDHRRRGIGQALTNYILCNGGLKDVYQWVLITKDAHGVYHKSGFKSLCRPDDWMEIRYKRPVR